MEEETEEIDKREKQKYFFDSYAVIEILKENPKYFRFRDEPIILSIQNLAEIYWHCLITAELESDADNVFSKFRKCVVEIDDETLKEAIRFRKENKKQDLSYTDCIGYIYAKRNNLKFLTGDKEFENLPLVEFVKK